MFPEQKVNRHGTIRGPFRYFLMSAQESGETKRRETEERHREMRMWELGRGRTSDGTNRKENGGGTIVPRGTKSIKSRAKKIVKDPGGGSVTSEERGRRCDRKEVSEGLVDTSSMLPIPLPPIETSSDRRRPGSAGTRSVSKTLADASDRPCSVDLTDLPSGTGECPSSFEKRSACRNDARTVRFA